MELLQLGCLYQLNELEIGGGGSWGGGGTPPMEGGWGQGEGLLEIAANERVIYFYPHPIVSEV